MSTSLQLALSEGTSLSADEEGVRLRGRSSVLSFPPPPAGLRAALEALAAGGVGEAELAELAGDDAPVLFFHLRAAAERQLLRWTLVHEGAALVSLAPTASGFVQPAAGLDEAREYQLSQFAFTRVHGNRVLLECALSHAVLTVHDRRVAALLFELARPVRFSELAGLAGGLDGAAVAGVLRMLAGAAMLESPEAVPSSESGMALRQWEFHDLLFHTRSRGTRREGRNGGTYRFAGEVPPPPAVKPPMAGEWLELFRPDLEALRQADAPFTEVLERRGSKRGPASSRLTARQLGEFLYRCARVRGLHPSVKDETSDRPYPGAGARYELELYPIVGECEDLPAGLYHYCPARHGLERLSGVTGDVRKLLESTRASGRPEHPPQVLLVVTARFQRVAWKYEGIAYSLILKDVGTLMQTMYLVATAMSLSPCALGWGDPDLFCRAAGLDYYAEGSVGEFMLSGPAP